MPWIDRTDLEEEVKHIISLFATAAAASLAAPHDKRDFAILGMLHGASGTGKVCGMPCNLILHDNSLSFLGD